MNGLLTNLLLWQVQEDAAKRSRVNRCGEAMRVSCAAAGLMWPRASTALRSHAILADDPAKYGWERVSPMTPGLQLVFFKRCGYLADGREAGHVALVSFWRDGKGKLAGVLIGNQNHKWTSYWQERVVGAFVPVTD